MTTTPRFRYIGTTDECTDCQRPGCTKVDLRSTVIIMPLDAEGNDDGEPTYYGSTCAAKALSIPGRNAGKQIHAAATGARLQTLMNAHDARRMLRVYGLPEAGEVDDVTLAAAAAQYAETHRNASWAWKTLAAEWRAMTLDMLARKQAAIAEAVLVAGTEWGKDHQPLDNGYRSVVKDTME